MMTELRNGREAISIMLDIRSGSFGCGCNPRYIELSTFRPFEAEKIVYEDGFFHVTHKSSTESYNARYVRSVVWVKDEK